jgi:saccharopine dehydrogenase-like NADP-dependent oxidoreductase
MVLGGAGLQGRAALFDLSRNDRVSEVLCVDLDPQPVESLPYVNRNKVNLIKADLSNRSELSELMKNGCDFVLDFLPPLMVRTAAEAAIEAGTSLVNTNYGYKLISLDQAAREAGSAIMPECGFDPGIDLVLYGYALREFDELQVINSYCGGLPEKKACTNPLNYKISWSWEAVLRTQKRDAVLMRQGQRVEVPAQIQHDNDFIHNVNIPSIGLMEAFPNGDAVNFTDIMNITDQIVETGRYSLRWPGWCDFWRPLAKFGFLSDEPIPDLPCKVNPFELMVKLMEPQLQYGPDEKDLAVMHNVFKGTKNGKQKTLVCNICVERDLATGLMGMNLAVAYPACIVGEMLVAGEIKKKGLLSPVKDIPVDLLLTRLKERGIQIDIIVED